MTAMHSFMYDMAVFLFIFYYFFIISDCRYILVQEEWVLYVKEYTVLFDN